MYVWDSLCRGLTGPMDNRHSSRPFKGQKKKTLIKNRSK